MGFTVEKLDPTRLNGVRVVGLAESDLADEGVRQQLRDLWVDQGLMLFEGKVTPSFHMALSAVFGPILPHPMKEYQLEGSPEILNLRFDPDDTDLWEIDGKVLGAWTPWHSDLVCFPKINHGGILRPHHVAAEGGATGFIDKIEAYDTLPDDIKAKIEDLAVVYRHRIDFREQRFITKLNRIELVRTHQRRIEDLRIREDRDIPPVVHPLVFRQPETGRRVLNLSPGFAERIHGMEQTESDELLTFLIDHITNPALAYFHMWKSQDEMVLWDNWRLLHQAAGVPATVHRVMYRTTIAGDYGLGRKLDDYDRERAHNVAA
jgi:taurine dioxygenase